METEETTLIDELQGLKDSINDPIIGLTRTIDAMQDDWDEETGDIPYPEQAVLDSLREDAQEAIGELQYLLETIDRLTKGRIKLV